MRQKGLTVITDILPGKTDALRSLLNTIGHDINSNNTIPFNDFETVHFLRWVIIDEAEVRGKKLSAKLVLSTNYDGPLSRHLKDLTEKALNGLHQIYSYCQGAPSDTNSQSMITYLKKHSRPIAAFYRGTAGRTVQQVHQEQTLWDNIQDYLQNNEHPEDADALRKNIQQHIAANPKLKWAKQKYKPELVQRFGTATLIAIVLLILGAIVTTWMYFPFISMIATGILLLVVLIWWFLLKQQEKKDEKAFIAAMQDSAQVAQLTKKEDYKVQNQLTHLVEIKPGFIRQYTLRFVLWAINLLAKFVFNKGNLGGIQSIHYARWVILDGGKRLLFFSNYDGSWESYLGEFVDRASVGLTGVWSNTMGFPPTNNLIKQGARYSAEFKAWAREKQIPTQVWYSAYPTSSIKNINNNTAIRQGLNKGLNIAETKAWLQRL